MELLDFNITSIRDEWHCWKSDTQNKRNDIRLGWKMVGWFCGTLLWSAKCWRPPGRRENTLRKTIRSTIERTEHPFGAMVEYYPISSRDQARLHQLGKKVVPGIFLGYALVAGGISKGDVMVADIEELAKLDASDILARRLNAQEIITSKKGEDFIFPVADDTAKLVGRDHEIRESTVRQYETVGSEDLSEELQRNSDESQSAETREGHWSPPRLLVDWRRLHLSSSCWTSSASSRAQRRIIPNVTEVYWRGRISAKRWRKLERRFLVRRHWRIGKDGRIGNLSSKNQCKRSTHVTKETQFHIPIADGPPKLCGRKTNSENPL